MSETPATRQQGPVAVDAAALLSELRELIHSARQRVATVANAEQTLLYWRLTRLLILLHKPSQHTNRKVYTFVPTQEWTRRWTDEDLYAKYGISASEIAFIEKIVRPMELQWSL